MSVYMQRWKESRLLFDRFPPTFQQIKIKLYKGKISKKLVILNSSIRILIRIDSETPLINGLNSISLTAVYSSNLLIYKNLFELL